MLLAIQTSKFSRFEPVRESRAFPTTVCFRTRWDVFNENLSTLLTYLFLFGLYEYLAALSGAKQTIKE
jgi:hypothetical protein